MKMKEVIAQTGIPEKTIRYYEERGLLHPETQRRNGRTYHEFSPQDVEALKSILVLRQVQFSIDEILSMQQSPERIPETVTACQGRIRAAAQAQDRFLSAQGLLEAKDYRELARQTHRALSGADTYESPMRFGLGDPETEEEKQAAITAFQEKKQFPVKNAVIVLLSVLCLLLSVSLGYLILQRIQTVPASTGSTQGWEYYLSYKGLMAAHSDGSQETLLYERAYDTQSLSYLVAEDKIFLMVENALYSMNYDGSGLYQYHPKYYSGYSGTPLLMGDTLFLTETQNGALGDSNSCIVALSVDGSGEEKVVDTSKWYGWSCWCWENQLYVLRGNEEDMELLCYDSETLTVAETFDAAAFLVPLQAQYETLRSDLLLADWDATAAYFTVGSFEGTDIYRITPEDVTGELAYQVPGYVWDMQGSYVVYSQQNQNQEQTYWLWNLTTDAQVELPSFSLNLSFTAAGVRLDNGVATTETTLIPYP